MSTPAATESAPAWKPFTHRGMTGCVSDAVPGILVFLSPVRASAAGRPATACPPAVPVTSVAIGILSADGGTCLSATSYPPDSGHDGPAAVPSVPTAPDRDAITAANRTVIRAAKQFALLYAAQYFQGQAEKCLELYQAYRTD